MNIVELYWSAFGCWLLWITGFFNWILTPIKELKQKREYENDIKQRFGELACLFLENKCPDCKQTNTMLKGPSGGMCTNIKCSNCGSQFNISPIGFAERIGR